MTNFDPAALLAESDLEDQEKLDELNKDRNRKAGRLISLVRQVEAAAKADDTLPLQEQIANAKTAIATYDAMLVAVTANPSQRKDKPGTPPAPDAPERRRPNDNSKTKDSSKAPAKPARKSFLGGLFARDEA